MFQAIPAQIRAGIFAVAAVFVFVLLFAPNAEAHRGHTVDNIMLEARSGNWDEVRHFITRHSGNVNSSDDEGFTLFHHAARDGQDEFLKFLIARNVEVPSEFRHLVEPPAAEIVETVVTVTVTEQAPAPDPKIIIVTVTITEPAPAVESKLVVMTVTVIKPAPVVEPESAKDLQQTEAELKASSTEGDSCKYANDGVCSEPEFCAPGTDTSDCVRWGKDQQAKTEAKEEEQPAAPEPQPAHAQEEKTKTERLLKTDLDSTVVGENGFTHLHWAVLANDGEALRRLIEIGVSNMNPKIVIEGVIGREAGDEIKALVNSLGIETSPGDFDEYTPLHLAAHFNNSVAASVLIANGAEVNAKSDSNRTPLHLAATYNSTETAALLLENGAKVNVEDGSDNQPLHMAAGNNATETAALLLKNGADVNAKDIDFDRYTPLHMAVISKETETAALLLENGAEVNAKDFRDKTPLDMAAERNITETAALLLKNGADVNAKDKDGLTPLHTALSRHSHETAALLLKNGADVNAKTNGDNTPLHVAIVTMSYSTEIATLLLENGADVNAKNWTGKTPLDYANGIGNRATQALLRENGGKCNKKC